MDRVVTSTDGVNGAAITDGGQALPFSAKFGSPEAAQLQDNTLSFSGKIQILTSKQTNTWFDVFWNMNDDIGEFFYGCEVVLEEQRTHFETESSLPSS